MKLVVNKDMKNNAYKVDLEVLDITDTDREKISDFGEIVVDVGGQILGKEIIKEYVPIQVPVTQTVTETRTVTEKQMVDETRPVLDTDGITPLYEDDGRTPRTQIVKVEKDVEVQREVQVVKPVLDKNGEPMTKDMVGEDGRKVYQLVEKEVDVVIADLGKQLRNFPSDFPISNTFTVAEYGNNAEVIANEYINLVKDALIIAVEALKEREDTFSGKEEIKLRVPKKPEIEIEVNDEVKNELKPDEDNSELDSELGSESDLEGAE